MKTPVERARAYIAKLPVAISGQRGHDTTFRVACSLVHGFALAHDDGIRLMHEYNARLAEQWTDAELRHKVHDAGGAVHRHPKGHLLGLKSTFKRVRAIPASPPIIWPIRRKTAPTLSSTHKEPSQSSQPNHEKN